MRMLKIIMQHVKGIKVVLQLIALKILAMM